MGEAAQSEVLPLEPTLAARDGSVTTPSTDPAESDGVGRPAGGSPAPASGGGDSGLGVLAAALGASQPDTPAPPTAPPSETDPLSDPLSPESSSREATPNSQAIGRIKLRKTSNALAAEQAPASSAPDSPRNLHEAFDSLTADLDRIADRIRPTWEAPSSRRVTRPGDNPEVVVHYPPEWQPPPSERRRLRANWKQATPTLPPSNTPENSELLDDGWGTADDDGPRTIPPEPVPELLETARVALTEPGPPVRLAREATPKPETNEATLSRESHAPKDKGKDKGKDKAPAFDSTAPSAVSQTPPVVPRSRAGLWGAGLAAAAVAALVWRSTHTPPAPVAAHQAERTSNVLQPAEQEPQASDVGALTRTPTPVAPPAPVTQAAPPSTNTDVAESPDAPATATSFSPPPSTLPASTLPASTPPVAPIAPAVRPAMPAAAPMPAAARDEAAAPAPAAEAPGPDPEAVAQALGESAAHASACRNPDGPNSAGSIRVLLNPAGGVLNATALGSFQGTVAGRCVENVFRTARTPAFEGRSLSTVYPFKVLSE